MKEEDLNKNGYREAKIPMGEYADKYYYKLVDNYHINVYIYQRNIRFNTFFADINPEVEINIRQCQNHTLQYIESRLHNIYQLNFINLT